jgi:integrase/recombinase XerC
MHIDSFLTYIAFQKKYSPHTVEAYRNDLDSFASFTGELSISESEIHTHKTIRKWVVYLSEKKISARSINRKLSALKSYYKYMIRKGEFTENPVEQVIRPKTEKKLPEFVDIRQMEILDSSEICGSDFITLRNLLIIEMLYCTGIRRAELISLQKSDVDLVKRQIKVLGKRSKERIIPFPDTLSDLLQRYFEYEREIVRNCRNFFVTEKGMSLYPKLVWRIVRQYLGTATTAKKRSPHILRHTYATHLINNGADINSIKELLGHSGLSATQIYTHTDFERLNQIYKQAHPRA